MVNHLQHIVAPNIFEIPGNPTQHTCMLLFVDIDEQTCTEVKKSDELCCTSSMNIAVFSTKHATDKKVHKFIILN